MKYPDTMAPKNKMFENTPEEQELVGELMYQWQYLYGLRGNWMSHWTEIAQRILPDHSWLFQNYAQLTQQGDKRNMEIFDSTGVIAIQRFGAILDSLLTPRDSFWHQIKSNDATVMRNRQARLWFDDVNQILFKQRYSFTSNFSSNNQNVYQSLGAYGTGCLFVDGLAGGPGLRYRNVHLSELYLQENHQGSVDRVCRRFMLTARQAWLQFGETCPEQILTKVKTAPDSQFFFLHWVMPNTDYDPYRKDAKGKKHRSYYVSIEGGKIVWDPNRPREQGYRMLPYISPRYRQAPNEAYGRSPAMDCLPAIKTLNEQKKTMLKQGHRIVDPIILAHDDGVADSFSLEPGTTVAGGISADGRLLVQPFPVGNIQAGKEQMEEERNIINDSFLVSLFQILTESPEMTATEVMERTREKGILLAPTIGRQQSEYLGPMIERELDILQAQGLLPKMPPIIAQSQGEYKIVYDSPISRAQRAEYASGATRALEVFTQFAQQTGNTDSLDIINMHVAGPEIADIYGTPAHWINSPEQIAEIKAQKQRQQAMQTAVQAGPAQAALMKAHAAMGGEMPTAQNPNGTPQGAAPMRPKQKVGRGRGPLGKPLSAK